MKANSLLIRSANLCMMIEFSIGFLMNDDGWEGKRLMAFHGIPEGQSIAVVCQQTHI